MVSVHSRKSCKCQYVRVHTMLFAKKSGDERPLQCPRSIHCSRCGGAKQEQEQELPEVATGQVCENRVHRDSIVMHCTISKRPVPIVNVNGCSPELLFAPEYALRQRASRLALGSPSPSSASPPPSGITSVQSNTSSWIRSRTKTNRFPTPPSEMRPFSARTCSSGRAPRALHLPMYMHRTTASGAAIAAGFSVDSKIVCSCCAST